MTRHPQRIAIFPGTFDPLTLGHLDVIERGAKLFDRLIVALGENPEKRALMGKEARLEDLRQAVASLTNVTVEAYSGLTTDFASARGAVAILRGLRGGGDLGYELQMAITNRAVAGLETLFVVASPRHAFTSSSLVRQIFQLGGDISALVPPEVLGHLPRR